MDTAVWVAIIGAVTAIITVTIPLLVSYFIRRIERNDHACEKRLEEMSARIVELEEDRDKAIKLAIEQYQKRNL